MVRTIVELWAGRVALGRAFWGYAVLCGLVVNFLASFAALIVVAAGGPPVLALAVHLLPLPWTVICAVGVWRSAERPEVTKDHAALARAGVIVWSLLLVVV